MKKSRMALTACVVAALAVGLAGLAGAITNGRLDGDQHPYVAMIDSGVFTCSGVAVSNRLVLTAAP